MGDAGDEGWALGAKKTGKAFALPEELYSRY